MKFTCSVDIDTPRNYATNLWENPDNLKEWQIGFQSAKHISGEPGKEGSTTELVYISGRNTIELLETILENKLPETYVGSYEHKHTTNTMNNVFTVIDDKHCRWTANVEYTVFNGFIIKMMSKLMPGMFRKQTQKWLDEFKAYAEREYANS